jgi:hypothetical protein
MRLLQIDWDAFKNSQTRRRYLDGLNMKLPDAWLLLIRPTSLNMGTVHTNLVSMVIISLCLCCQVIEKSLVVHLRQHYVLLAALNKVQFPSN